MCNCKNLVLHWLGVSSNIANLFEVVKISFLVQANYLILTINYSEGELSSNSSQFFNTACKQNISVHGVKARNTEKSAWLLIHLYLLKVLLTFVLLFFDLCSVTCILRWASYKENPLCPQCKHPFESLSVHRSLDGWLALFFLFLYFFISCLYCASSLLQAG